MDIRSKISLQGLDKNLLSIAERIAVIPILAAIRSALIVTLPIVFLGSLAELMLSFPLPAYREFMADVFGPNWTIFGVSIRHGTFAVMSLIMIFSLGQHLAEQYNSHNQLTRVSPVIAGLISFVSFLCLLPANVEGGFFANRWLGVAGLFIAMLVGLLSGKLFLFLFSFKRLHFRLPGGAPDVGISQAFNSLLPGILTVGIFAAAGVIVPALTGVSIHEAVHNLIRMPFESIEDGLGRGMVYILSLHSLWFFGIHGANVLDPITHDIYGAAITANEAAKAMGLPLPHVMTKAFMDIFVFMGGSGCTLSLAAALLIFGKSPANRKLGGIAIVPGIFNINEVLLFGLPIILNPLMLLPFICTPLILAAVSYVAVSSGLVPGTSVNVEWTTPIFLNSYLATGSIRGPILQACNMALGIIIYAPFILLSNRINERRTKAAFSMLMDRACSVVDYGTRCIESHDDAGSLARSLLSDLAFDLEKNKGVYLEYQPQVSSTSGRVVGVESLIRWRHELYGNIAAPIIISLAEESGLIRPLGLRIFEESCATRKLWLDLGLADLIISVNVSALQLHEGLPDEFMEILQKYDLNTSMIELEVTESSALDAGTPESEVLSTLHSRGFLVAIDDFGMGHSSLKYLKQFPVNTVKIDGAISREVVTNSICADIVASITRLCRVRNMTSVAEFVENAEQAATLRNLGCDVFQGWYYSKSLLAGECFTFILNNNTPAVNVKNKLLPDYTGQATTDEN